MEASRLLVTLSLLWSVSSVSAFSGFGSDVDFYIEEAAKRYQVSQEMLRGLVKIENGWNNNVSPTGATGVGQFTMGTWNWLSTKPEGRALGMMPVTPQNRGTRYDPRRNKRVNTLATGLLARWHISEFGVRGIAVTDANLYMAHNIGVEGFHRALLGRATADDIRNMRRNGMKRWMSVRDFIIYQKKNYHNHKLIANSNIRTTTAHSAPMVAKQSVKQTSSVESSSSSPKTSSSLRWVQPSDRQIVWVNPVHKL